MRDEAPSDDDQPIHSGPLTLLYVDLLRVQDRTTLRDRQLTATSLGLSSGTTTATPSQVTSQVEIPRPASAMMERRMSTVSIVESVAGERDEFEGDRDEKLIKPTAVRYHRLDDRLRFANTLVAANSADIIIIDSWPEECLMRTSFPALDTPDEEESYVTKTAFRPNGGRGTMIAVKKRCLVSQDDRRNAIGLISLDRLVKRSWTPANHAQGGLNQAWLHAVDAGPASYNHNKPPIRLAIVAYDCGKGYRFQNGINEAIINSSLSKSPAALFSSRLFLNCRSSSFSKDGEGPQKLPTIPTGRPASTIYDAKNHALMRSVQRSSSTVGVMSRSCVNAKPEQPGHIWWRGATGAYNGSSLPNGNAEANGINGNGHVSGTSTPKQRERKNSNSWIETRAATPMEEAEERIRIASELKQLKSFLSVSLANQIGERRRHLERRASETSLDKFNNVSQATNGAVALVVGRFGINSLPLAQSLASCSNTHMTNMECDVTVCDNDRCETMAALWWRSKNRHQNIDSHVDNPMESRSSSSDELDERKNGNPISINDSTALLDYDRNEWLEAEFECRPRMFTVTFH